MGVDYYGCDCCGESRYEEYVGSCTECGTRLCTSCVVNDDIGSSYAHEYGLKFDSTKVEEMKILVDKGYSLYKEDGTPWYEDGDLIDESSIDKHYCPYCSGNNINTDMVYAHIVEKYNIDVQKEWDEIKGK